MYKCDTTDTYLFIYLLGIITPETIETMVCYIVITVFYLTVVLFDIYVRIVKSYYIN